MNSNKRVLITGSNGFIGQHLIKSLCDTDILAFDVQDGDIVNHDIQAENISHIYHLAARTSAPESWDIPYDYYNTNIMGTVNMLELCRKHNASLSFISTYPYGTPQYIPINETHPTAPNTVYNHSKCLAEDICSFYATHYDVPITILRLFNVYGEGQSDKFLIPHIVKQALFEPNIEVMDLEPQRDYVYISDVIDALLLSQNGTGFRVYNVGSGETKSVKEVCECVNLVLGEKKSIVSKEKRRKNEVTNIVSDISKIRSELGWTPKVSFDNGMKKMIDFYKSERA